MSSYQEEYRKGFEAGLESARKISESMYQDGYEKGLKEMKTFGDLDKDTFYHLTKLFSLHGVVDNPKLVNAYKTYITDEGKSLRG
jgi:hypothetical protein